jgi:acyl carrier protein
MDEVVARQAIADHFGVPVSLVVDEADLRDLGADSLDIIELSVALEQQFDIRIPDDEIDSCTSVGEAMALLRRSEPLRRAARVPLEAGSPG